MELDNGTHNVTPISSTLIDFDPKKSKSSQRKKYESEVAAIKNRWGDIEEIRKKCDLSRRKMCHLLLVDPSAWSRWSLPNSDAPPHIYRALDFYLQLMELGQGVETAPEGITSAEFERFKEEMTRRLNEKSQSQPPAIDEQDIQYLQTETRRLKDQLEKQEQITLMWKFILLINCAVMAYFLLDSLL